ncbi:MAG: alpha/beta hydrolase [Planctomycetota bacterium]
MSRSRLDPVETPGAAIPSLFRQGIVLPAAATRTRPPRLWVPEGYEGNYPYPLLMWLHDDGQSDAVLDDVMPRLSDRNFIGAAVRAEFFANGQDDRDGFRWSSDAADRSDFVGRTHAAACEVRRCYHVHSERAFLVGIGRGAAVAAEVFTEHPEWFGGLIAIDPPAELAAGTLPARSLEETRVLVAREGVAGMPAVARLAETARPFSDAGADVDIEITATAHHTGTPSDALLRKINAWVVAGLYAPV